MRFLFQITFYSNYFLAPETGSFFISYMMKSDEKSDFKSSQNEYPPSSRDFSGRRMAALLHRQKK